MSVEQLFETVAERLLAEDPELRRGRMMTAVGLKTGRKFFAMTVRGELVVKLPAERVDDLVAEGAGERFDPGHGRPMREWVGLRPQDEDACEVYVRDARDFVAALAAR